MKDEHGKVTHPGYPEAWYRTIVEQQGEHFKMRSIEGEPEPCCPPLQVSPNP